MQVLPPANGKKLWRVKRSLSTGNPASLDANLSLECLNSSLKITAAGKQFMSKRPPLKRPKCKPGMPKDFVFVDLSPVKSSEDEEGSENSSVMSVATSSPTMAFSGEKQSPLSLCDEFFASFEDEAFGNFTLGSDLQCGQQPMFENAPLLGLGLFNMPIGYAKPSVVELALQMQQEQLAFQRFLQYQSQFLHTPQVTQTPFQPPVHTNPINMHKRSKSISSIPRRKSAGGFQFKTYKGPNSVKKPLVRKHRRSVLEPTLNIVVPELATSPFESELKDFLHAPRDDLSFEDIELFDLAYTPLTDFSDFENVETLHKPIDLDILHGCDTTQLFKDEFDMSNFVSI